MVLSLSLTTTSFSPASAHFLAQAASTLAPHLASLIQPLIFSALALGASLVLASDMDTMSAIVSTAKASFFIGSCSPVRISPGYSSVENSRYYGVRLPSRVTSRIVLNDFESLHKMEGGTSLKFATCGWTAWPWSWPPEG